MADHLRYEQIRTSSPSHRHHALERLRTEPIILIAEEDVVAARRVDADIARLARPTRVRLVDDVDITMRDRKPIEELRGLVRGPVVDEDDLATVKRHGLAEIAGNAHIDVPARVIDRHNNADVDAQRELNLRSVRLAPWSCTATTTSAPSRRLTLTAYYDRS